jgi:hypothetical protein
MMIDGVKVTTKEELEAVIKDMLPESQESLRAIFAEWSKPTPQQRDLIKYRKRAAVKDQIIAEMATENVDRLRRGVWTTPQLIALTQDAELKLVQDDINSLSFELAVMKLNSVSNPLITPDIKLGWIQKVMKHYYNEGS